MIELPDGTVLLTVYVGSRTPTFALKSCIIRSRDGGKTWGDVSEIAENSDETALLYLPSGKMIAMLRRSIPEHGRPSLWQSVSEDKGYSWTEPKQVTQPTQIPADLLLLKSGRILLTFGHRTPPCGVRGLISRDEGDSWDYENSIILAAESLVTDCGYPSSVQLDDGSIFTAYYVYESRGPFLLKQFNTFGPHGAGVKYTEADLL